MVRTLLSPVSELQQMIDFMDRAFNSAWSESSANRANPNFVYSLPVDIWQKDNACFIRAALPGVKPEDLDVQVQDGFLTISGELKPVAHAEENISFWRREYTYGKFTRSIRLPDFAIAEKVEASFEHGFVTITVPLAIQQPKSLRVPIRTVANVSTPALEQNAEDSGTKKTHANA